MPATLRRRGKRSFKTVSLSGPPNIFLGCCLDVPLAAYTLDSRAHHISGGAAIDGVQGSNSIHKHHRGMILVEVRMRQRRKAMEHGGPQAGWEVRPLHPPTRDGGQCGLPTGSKNMPTATDSRTSPATKAPWMPQYRRSAAGLRGLAADFDLPAEVRCCVGLLAPADKEITESAYAAGEATAIIGSSCAGKASAAEGARNDITTSKLECFPGVHRQSKDAPTQA
mmetsp:Transcript_65782/g.190594  ORF Transcript_65782/g.190594 Transcript_65782/m.190594 type:complete len:224 (-) Transcript_65782:1-672(-)